MICDINKINLRVKECRIQKGFTQENLAELCAVSRQAVTKWESGKSIPDIKSLITLTKLFNVEIEYLLGLNANEKKLPSSSISHELINEGLKEALSKNTIEETIKEYLSFVLQSMAALRISVYEYVQIKHSFHVTYVSKQAFLNEGYNEIKDIPFDLLSEWKNSVVQGNWIYIDNCKLYFDHKSELKEYLYDDGISSIVLVPILNGKAFVRLDSISSVFVSDIKEFYKLSLIFLECFLKRRNILHKSVVEIEKCRQVNEIMGYATYSCNVLTGEIKLNQNFYTILDIKSKIENIEDARKEIFKHPQEDEALFHEVIRKILAHGEGRVQDIVYCLADGRTKLLNVTVCPFVNKDGILAEVYGVIEDITHRHQNFEQYNNIIKNIPGGIYRCCLQDKLHIEYVSDGFLQLIGYTREYFEKYIVDNYLDIVYEEDRDLYKEFVYQQLAKEGTHSCRYRIKTNNIFKYVMDTMESVKNEDGKIYGYSNLVDISCLNNSQIY